MSNYQLLILKLNEFIRKYYLNKLIRGILLTLAFITACFLLINLLESYFYFSTSTRTFLFYSFVIAVLSIVSWGILFPLLKLFRISETINHADAASIIGSHFSNIQDKLLNILQLKNHPLNYGNNDLIEASINQKIENIKLIPFTSAIDFGKNKKYARYALIPILSLLMLLLFYPSVIKESTRRIILYDTTFEKPAPFQFLYANNKQEVVQYSDLPVQLFTKGASNPMDVFILIDGYEYKMKKNAEGDFSYLLKNIQKKTTIQFVGGGYNSALYTVNVLKKPIIKSFDVMANYPDYTGRKDELLNNIGDVVVPQGTVLTWKFETDNTDNITLRVGNTNKKSTKESNDTYKAEHRFLQDETYTVFFQNNKIATPDSAQYSVVIVPDNYPAIQVQSRQDSTDKEVQYFVGEASDDYGINKVELKYSIKDEQNKSTSFTKKIKTEGTKSQQQFSYILTAKDFGLKAGESLTYYFEVWDNDAVNGSKSAKTQLFAIEKASVKQEEKNIQKNSDEIIKQLESSVKDAEKLQQKAEQLQEKLLQKKQVEFQDKQNLQQIAEKQEEIKEKFKEAQKKLEENLKTEQELNKDKTEEIKKKEEELKKMMENTLNKEMDELMKKIDDLMRQLNKDEQTQPQQQKEQALENLDQMQEDQQQLKKDLERMKELYKQLEVEKKLDDVIKKMDEIAEKQEQLSEKTADEKADKEALKNEQEKLTKEFDDLKKEMNELQEKNDELKRKMELPDMDAEQQSASEEQKNAEENIEKGDNNKAQKNQKNASKKMKEMASKMKQAKQKSKQKQYEEDMEALRQLLDNLVQISYDEEKLINQTQTTSPNEPQFNTLTQQQHKLKQDFRIIQDSLETLSQRIFELQSFINDKVSDINKGFKKTIEFMEQKNVRNSNVNQQYLMTWMNDLALMLSEALEQMQQNAANQMPGDQMCQNPGNKPGKKPGKGKKLGQGSGMQQQLNDKIEEMSGKPNKSGKPKAPGDKQGGQQQGANGTGGQQNGKEGENKPNSKDFAQMAQMQQAIRQALQEMKEKQGNDGKSKDGSALQRLIDQMNKTEEELFNKQITAEMLNRQKEILTQLLQYEQAEREQDQKEERESQSAQNIQRKLPSELEQYLKKRKAEIDRYRNVPPNLQPYYKKLVESYYNAFKD